MKFDSPHFLLLIVYALLSGCGSDSNSSTSPIEPPVRPPLVTKYLYTQTNDPEGNAVVAFQVNGDGKLTEIGSFSTNSVGDADDGDFDSQGAVRVFWGLLVDC